MLVTGCESVSHVATSDFCRLYEPVYTHESDTEKTKTQVDGNNVVWEKLCAQD